MRTLLRIPTALLFRVHVEGRANLAGGEGHGQIGFICAGVPHRTWAEPVLLLSLLPGGRRAVTVADGATVSRSWWRRLATRLVGGAIPVGRGSGSAGFAGHVAAAAQIVGEGGVVVIFPESGPPTRPPQLRRIAAGLAHLAAATGAPVVPVIFGGTDELYLRRRIVVRALPPIAPPPRDPDRQTIATWMADFSVLVQTGAAAADELANLSAPGRKRWRWLSGPYPRAD